MPKLKYFINNNSNLLKNECELKLRHINALKAFSKNDFNLVIEETNWIIDNYKMEFDWLLGFAYMIRGKTYDKLLMRELAIKDYKSVVKLDNYYPEIEEAKQLIKLPYK